MSSDRLHDPLLQAIIDLRYDESKTSRDKQLEFNLAFLPFLSAWLDCAPVEAVRASMRYGLHACDRYGQCQCGRHLSEAHLQHGNHWTPPAPTALAKAWTESDQQDAFFEGWLLLVDRQTKRPAVVAVPGGVYDGVPDLAACIRERAERGEETAQKAVAIIGSLPERP